VVTGAGAEDEQFGQGVPTESVRAVERDAGRLAGGVEAVDAGPPFSSHSTPPMA